MNALPSKKQHALLAYIEQFIKENNFAPSYREVMRALDYKSVSTVAKHIEGLIDRGWLVKRDNSARSVEVVYKTSEQGALAENAGKSPALVSSLPASDEWLRALIDSKRSDEHAPLGADELLTVVSALHILGLDSLAARYEFSEPEETERDPESGLDIN